MSLCHSAFVFFFSSRRRHTRLQGDWSSDVCSSDLYYFGNMKARGGDEAPRGSQFRAAVERSFPTYDIWKTDFVSVGKMRGVDRKSTRLNSSHLVISYAVFCLKKKNKSTPPSHTADT